VFNVATDPGQRRLGYARGCVDALLAWFRDETPARKISLHATGEGIGIYRSRGFAEPAYPELVLRITDQDRHAGRGAAEPWKQ
jgi:ribosomal protein S18 acetylase RimI-like enzyme